MGAFGVCFSCRSFQRSAFDDLQALGHILERFPGDVADGAISTRRSVVVGRTQSAITELLLQAPEPLSQLFEQEHPAIDETLKRLAMCDRIASSINNTESPLRDALDQLVSANSTDFGYLSEVLYGAMAHWPQQTRSELVAADAPSSVFTMRFDQPIASFGPSL